MARSPRASLAVLGVLLVSLLLAGCDSLQGTNEGGYVAGDRQVLQIAPADRGEPVELSGKTLEGDALDLADLRGRVVVVNTWWSGCPPCRTEMPMLTRAAKKLGDEAAFVGINIRDLSAAQGLAFERSLDVGFPSIYSPGGEALLAFSGKVSPAAVPSTAVLDKDGRVAAVISGAIPSELTLTELVHEVATADG
jgi:thiol-disulfide isomerase/thioredoxin